MSTFLHCLGSRGGITQVRVTLLNKNQRQLVRNVKGPCKEKDVLALLESEREARRLRWARPSIITGMVQGLKNMAKLGIQFTEALLIYLRYAATFWPACTRGDEYFARSNSLLAGKEKLVIRETRIAGVHLGMASGQFPPSLYWWILKN